MKDCSKFKVGEYVRILSDANLSTSGFNYGDVVQIYAIADYMPDKWVYLFKGSKNGVGFFEHEIELAEDFILKEIWK